jgi:hypothetical protein
MRLLALGLALQATACAAKLDPLPIKEVEPGKPATLDPTLAAAGGNLAITRDGKSRLPYATGLDGGCVAGTIALALVWLPLDVLLGGNLMPPGGGDCEHRLPSFVIVQLESRHAAVLVIQKYGDFVAQLPTGTYLVAEVMDDKSLVPLRFGFQIPKSGHAYDLGVIAIDDGSLPRATITAHSDVAFAQLMTELPGAADWPKSPALLIQISSARDSQSAQVYFIDKKNLDAYLTAATIELKDHGMPLLTSETGAPAAASPVQQNSTQTASMGTQSQATSPSGPADVPFKIDDGFQTVEGIGKLEHGHLSGQIDRDGRLITLAGDVHSDGLMVALNGALLPTGVSVGQLASNSYCSADGTAHAASGNVAIPMNATCGANNKQITLYLTLPPP